MDVNASVGKRERSGASGNAGTYDEDLGFIAKSIHSLPLRKRRAKKLI
jgi:hypothetical protein